jgi:outer membrane receptor for ferrienterochelin and colicins
VTARQFHPFRFLAKLLGAGYRTNKPIYSLLVLVFILSVSALASQSRVRCSGPISGESGKVQGRIVDATAGAVEGARVVVECGGTKAQAATDSAGNFTVEVPAGSYRIHAKKEGFESVVLPVDVAAGQSTSQDIEMMLAGQADTITVTAGGFEQLVRDAPASVTVVGMEELQTRRVSDIAQALLDVEGVDVGMDVGKTGGPTISMRGMPSDYTLMLIDGKRQNAAGNVTPNGFGETATSFMPPVGAIDRIEVVRGPMSTLYGSDAMGGVVNIITRKVGERWSGTITGDGTFQTNRDYGDTRKGSFYLTGPIVENRLGLALRGSAFRRDAASLAYRNADGQEVPITTFGSSPTKSDIQNVGGRLSYVLNDHNEIYGDFDTVRQQYNNDNRQLGTVGLQGGYEEKLRFNRTQAMLSHVRRFSFGQLDTSFTRNTTETLGRTIPPGTPERNPGDPRTLEATNNILDSKLVAGLGTRHMLTVGGQWWDANMVDAVAPDPYDHRQAALFVEDEWRILRPLALTTGLRYDNHNVFGGNLSPRAYLVYNATNMLTLKGGVSRGFRTPQLNQLASGITGFGGQGTIPLIGSPGLKPETSTSTEVGAFLTVKDVIFNVTLFNNQFQDKIASGPGLPNCSFAGSPNRPGCVDFGNWPNVDLFGQQINVDEAVTRGVESSVRFSLLRRINVQQNYTYTYSEQKSGQAVGQPLVNTPKHMYNSTIRYRATRKLNTWLRLEARTSRTRGTSATMLAATEQLGPYKPYTLAHLGFGYELTKDVMLNATIYNLFDKDFLGYRPYIYNNVINYASEYNNLQEPRRFWVSLTYSF